MSFPLENEAFAVPVLSPTAANTEIDTLEMEKGDLLVFNNLVFHRSLFNRSDIIRWSVDFRFSRTGTSLDGLWHEAIACPAREHSTRRCPTSWQTWRAQWETSPHKGRFV